MNQETSDLPLALNDAMPEQSGAEGNGSRRKVKTAPRPFPMNSLEEAMQIPRALKEYNGGNPWSPSNVAHAIGVGEKGNKFYYLTASSRDYGLTTGIRGSDKIELTNLGKQIVYPTSQSAEADSMGRAFFNVDLFKAVYEHYSGGQLPELKYLKNTLITEFQVSEEYVEDFYEVFQKNVSYVKRLSQSSGPQVTGPKGADSPASHVTLGQPDVSTTLRAFVVMPFSEKTPSYPKGFFDEVLRSLITPAAVSAGFKVETARRDGSDLIHATIVNDLADADLVIVDLTEHNPNVLFELGMRIVFEKPIALIRAVGTSQIFDVDNLLRVFSYDPRLWKSTLEQDLPKLAKHIQGAWDSRNSGKSYLQLLRNK